MFLVIIDVSAINIVKTQRIKVNLSSILDQFHRDALNNIQVVC